MNQDFRIWSSSKRQRADDRGVLTVRRGSPRSWQRRNWPNPLGRAKKESTGFAGLFIGKCGSLINLTFWSFLTATLLITLIRTFHPATFSLASISMLLLIGTIAAVAALHSR